MDFITFWLVPIMSNTTHFLTQFKLQVFLSVSSALLQTKVQLALGIELKRQNKKNLGLRNCFSAGNLKKRGVKATQSTTPAISMITVQTTFCVTLPMTKTASLSML